MDELRRGLEETQYKVDSLGRLTIPNKKEIAEKPLQGWRHAAVMFRAEVSTWMTQTASEASVSAAHVERKQSVKDGMTRQIGCDCSVHTEILRD